MSYISEITENNARIPHEFYIPVIMNSYLSGFSAQASISYTKDIFKCSSIPRISPKIVIRKQGNISLMSAVNSALNLLGVASVYNKLTDPGCIYIYALESIKKFIDLGLCRSSEKMGRLKELYDYWKDTKELDDYGAYQKLKDKIRLQRDENKPGAYVEKAGEDEPEEVDEAEPTDEHILKED